MNMLNEQAKADLMQLYESLSRRDREVFLNTLCCAGLEDEFRSLLTEVRDDE